MRAKILFLFALCLSVWQARGQTPGGVASDLGFYNILGTEYTWPTSVLFASSVAPPSVTNIGISPYNGSPSSYTTLPYGGATGGTGYVLTGNFRVPHSGLWRISVASDDGARLIIRQGATTVFTAGVDGNHPCDSNNATFAFDPTVVYTFDFRYFNHDGPGCLDITWQNISGPFVASWANSHTIPIYQNTLRLWTYGDSVVGANVSQWTDKSTNNQHLVQGTAADRPTWVNNSTNPDFNYNPYINFTSKFLERANYNGFGTGAHFLFLVNRRAANNREESPFSYATDSEDNAATLFFKTDSTILGIDGAGILPRMNLNFIDGQQHIFANFHGETTVPTDSNYYIWKDGDYRVRRFSPANRVPAPNGNNKRRLTIGREQDACCNSGTYNFQAAQDYLGDIAEIIQYNRGFYPAEFEKINTYLAIKYGITLANYNYYASNDAQVVYDRTVGAYNNNIFGVARDNNSGLNQTISQTANAGCILTISTPAIVTASSYLVMGDNGANTNLQGTFNVGAAITQNNRQMIVTERVWKVTNTNFGNTANLSFDLPSILGGAVPTTANFFLVISNSQSFGTLTQQPIIGTISGNVLTFPNVQFGTNTTRYFRIGKVNWPAEVTFSNQDTGRVGTGGENTWEACALSDVNFVYEGFERTPDRIVISTRTSFGTVVRTTLTSPAITVTPNVNNDVPLAGTISLTLPDSAVSGLIYFYSGTDSLYQSPSFLTVNNPVVDLTIPAGPYCADDSISLTGLPTGGNFRATILSTGLPPALAFPADWVEGIASTTSTSIGRFNGPNVFDNWADNLDSINVQITYTITPTYQSFPAVACPRKDDIVTFTLRDNRLTQVLFAPVIAQNRPIAANESIGLMSILDTVNIRPHIDFNLLQPRVGRDTLPTFSGLAVNQVGNSFRLNYGINPAQLGYNVNVRFNNRGCIAQREGSVIIIPKIQPTGLDSVYCADANPLLGDITQYNFTRDVFLRDTFTFDTLEYHVNNAPRTILKRRVHVATGLPYAAASVSGMVSCVSSCTTYPTTNVYNSEVFAFYPNQLPASAALRPDTIYFPYQIITKTINYNTSGVATDSITFANTNYTAKFAIRTLPRDSAIINGLINNGDYCSYNADIPLSINPAFYRIDTAEARVPRYNVNFTLRERSTNRNDNIALVSDTIVRFGTIISQQTNDPLFGPGRDVPERLIYTVNKFGCTRRDTVDFTVRAFIRNMQIGGRYTFDTVSVQGVTNNHFYCLNEASDLISTIPARGSGTPSRPDSVLIEKYFFAMPGTLRAGPTLITNGQFNPNDTAYYRMTYIYWDIYQCRNEIKDTFFVKKPLNMSLTTIDNRTGYCATDTTKRAFRISLGSLTWQSDFVTTPSWLRTRPNFTGSGLVVNTSTTPSLTYFQPNTIPTGSYNITANFTDSVSCPANLVINITTTPVPQLRFYGDTSFAVPDVAYCRNESIQRIFPSINATFAPNFGGNFNNFGAIVVSGAGVIADSANRVYNYNPALPANGRDTIRFVVRDGGSCTVRDSLIVQLDTVPRVRFTNLSNVYCRNQADTVIVGFPSTGFFGGTSTMTSPSNSGFNTSTRTISPLTSIIGQHTITYSYTDSRGCRADTTRLYQILAKPDANFNGLALQYCKTDLQQSITGTRPAVASPAVGTAEFGRFWIVDSVPNRRRNLQQAPTSVIGSFKPDTLRVGPVTVYYAFTDSSGCSDTTRQNTYINPIPTVQIVGLDSVYCKSNEPRNVIGVPATSLYSILDNRPNGLQLIASNVGVFSPGAADTGVHRLSYRYTDPITSCTDSAVFRVRVLPAIAPTITGLPSATCENRDTVIMTGAPTGGVFSGVGVPFGSNLFIPIFAGRNAQGHIVQYAVRDTFVVNSRTVICQNVGYDTVIVNGLPTMSFSPTAPANNSRFCNTDSEIFLMGARGNTTTRVDSILGRQPVLFSRDTSFRGAGIFVRTDTFLNFPSAGQFVIDTTYFFQPSRAGYGQHTITLIGTNPFGCTDSTQRVVFVDSIPDVTFPALNTTYCENESGVQVVGSPLGGTLYRDNRNITAAPTNGFFIPNPNYPTSINTAQADTIKYVYQYIVAGQVVCADSASQIVTINPVPQVSFTGENITNEYCLIPDSVTLTPNIVGGVFSGNGVQFGTNFFVPVLSNVGKHVVTYSLSDSASGCKGSYEDTLIVYSQPNVEFAVVGGCQDVLINFNPTVTNISGIFQNVPFDTVTQVRWTFGDGQDSVIVPARHNVINSVNHLYNTIGTFFATLAVTNQDVCTDSVTYRVNVVPKISLYPHAQDFAAGTAGWIAEDNNSSPQTTWEWGLPNNLAGINSLPSGNDEGWITTLANGYPVNNKSFVYSPCFDLTGLDRPMMAFDYWVHTLEGADGAVIEFYDENGDWKPLGDLDRGINWYNSDIIVGAPGAQTVAPIGWSGVQTDFTNGRYLLDEIRYGQDSTVYKNFRFRVGFGSSGLQQTAYDGFAFDNVWIGNRNRNVLVEHFANGDFNNMNNINQHIYQLIFGTPLVRDAVLIQYNTSMPSNDEFNQQYSTGSNARLGDYGSNISTGYSVLDGVVNTNIDNRSIALNAVRFEMDMLQDAKFLIDIDSFSVATNRAFIHANITAQEDLPQDNYIVHIVVVEDSLTYQGGNSDGFMVHAVCRQMLPNASGTEFNQPWSAGENQAVAQVWNFDAATFNYRNLEAVVFVQSINTKQVFQVSTTRDITAFINALGVATSPTEQAQFNELQAMNLFPNPTTSHFNVQFQEPLKGDYRWNLIDLQGRSIRQGNLTTGMQQLQVTDLELPSGTYIFTAQNGSVYTQRKVVIYRP